MVRDFSQKTVQELYETIRVNVDEEEQWKVFDFVEDFFMEELEIGDYINDINSYHLHMFDKHDVTTKKFDAIVEKAGKVDANYAAQIEGYCSLLGEYGKKFEAVCAMLQPEKLRLSPDKYREKLEGINTGYQNAKDTHEQEQSDYEAELYEIETVWYKKMLDKAEDYLIRSAECIVLGNFTDEVTVLGVGVQIVLGIFDLDLPCDIRDIIADVRNLAQADEIKWDMIAMLALDLIGVIPVIGALKYSDEIGTLFKNADKVSVVARSTDGAGVLAKHADEAGAWLHGVKVFKYSDETAEAVASGEKLLKESGTIYESFADMMSPEDAKRYLDFLENGSREGLTGAELAGVEKADALLVSRKVEYEDVWDLRNVGDALESGTSSELKVIGTYDNNNYFTRAVEFNAGSEGTGFTYKVYQRNDIDWNIVRTTGAKKGRGLTNAQAAEKYGLAPILNDGYVATLHHSQQRSVGPLFETSTRYHNISNAKKGPLHPYKGQLNPFNPMDSNTRGLFQKADSIEYWKARGRDAMKGVQ